MSNVYESMGREELDAQVAALEREADDLRARDLSLDMTRGKPSIDQTALSYPLLDLAGIKKGLDAYNHVVENYGMPDGLPAARKLTADLLGIGPANVIVSGSSSLHLEFDMVTHGFTCGIAGCDPWYAQGGAKFLCPAPGYDRHFAITAHYGIENIPISMGPDGPDMDEVERLVEGDPAVKGIWCVPKYSNPTGCTYSDETVRRFARLRPAAPDFRIYWDNAYMIHGFREPDDQLLNIFDAMEEAGTHDLVYEFASFSKVTFPGSAMAWVGASASDIIEIHDTFAVEQVGPEKFTQLVHTLYFSSPEDVMAHMHRQADLLAPRFDLVESKLSEGLGNLGVATWTHPNGGYFVSFDGPEGSAKRIVALAADLGVKLTPAGATWPYGEDPHDSNVRIAPTYPPLDELGVALDVFVVAVKLVSAQMAREARG